MKPSLVCAVVLDTNHNREFPAHKPLLGRALASYPLLAAKASQYIARTYLATDSKDIKAIALQHGTIIIDPPHSAGAHAVEVLLKHSYHHILKELKAESETLEFLAVLLANAPGVTGEIIDSGVEALRDKPEADSALSVSQYNHLNPCAAKKESKEGLLEPYAAYHREAHAADVWHADGGVAVLRPRALDLSDGPPPYPWLGKKIIPLKETGASAIDHAWQVPAMEYWLKAHGVSDVSHNMEMQPKPKPQAAPKGDRR